MGVFDNEDVRCRYNHDRYVDAVYLIDLHAVDAMLLLNLQRSRLPAAETDAAR